VRKNVGFACKLFGQNMPSMKSCILKNATFERLLSVSKHNLDVLDFSLDYCAKNKIFLLRIGSDIIPFASHKDVIFDWKSIFHNELTSIGKKIKKLNIRVSMHPSAYTVINSPNILVIENSIRNLKWHSDFLCALDTSSSSKIVLHVGGVYNDRNASKQRFIDTFNELPECIKKRIILENDEKCYSIDCVLDICHEIGIPAVFDVLHNSVFQSIRYSSDRECILACKETWKHYDGIQKIHYSQQAIGKKIGSHSETIDVEDFLLFYSTVADIDLDIMLEVKDKNVSAIKCIQALEEFQSKKI